MASGVSILRWVLGIIAIVVGSLILLVGLPITALVWMGVGVFITPPVANKLRRWKPRLLSKWVSLLLLLLMVFSLYFSVGFEANKGLKELRREYAQKHDALLQQMKSDFNAGKYEAVIEIGKKYEAVSANEFNGLYWDAYKKSSEKQEAERRKSLRVEFKQKRASIIKEIRSYLESGNSIAANELIEKYGFIEDAEFTKLSKQVVRVSQVKLNKDASSIVGMDEGKVKAIALTLCKSEVRRQLKAPSTADFPWLDGQITLYPASQTAVFSSYVDAQNGFGAMIRTNYACTIKLEGADATDVNNWAVIKVSTF